MTPAEFAARHFPEFKQKGEEIIPTYCPLCKGGPSGDKHSFAMNINTGDFNCKRGSCGREGKFITLLKEFNEAPQAQSYDRAPVRKNYKKPKTELMPASTATEKYLAQRKISKVTLDKMQVSENDGNIVFPYYENGELVMLKFRPARKVKKGERKAWREEGGRPVFWGMDHCTHNKPLIICEGEIDALTLVECGVENVVSVPSGAEDLTCVDLCWDWLEGFKKIIIWPDNDEPGQGMCDNLIKRLGAWRCYTAGSERKDANEVLYFDGSEAVVKAIQSAKEVPIHGLTRLYDAQVFDYEKAVRVRSGVPALDKVMGGFIMGQTSIWTGINSSGKSTLLGQIMLDAIEQNYAVCAYSGELPAALFRYWIDLQAAGPDHIKLQEDKFRGKINDGDKYEMTPRVQQEKIKLIRAWYKDMFFLYDSFGSTTDADLLDVFKYAAMRYDCKVFMIDNLMTTAFADGGEKDFYRRQSDFMRRVVEFAQTYDVHIHMVAHPRKTDGQRRLTKMDIAGTGDITNRADNVFSLHRCNDKERTENNCDSILDVFKNRFSGRQEVEIKLKFCQYSKRFAMATRPEDLSRGYGWTKLAPWEVEE